MFRVAFYGSGESFEGVKQVVEKFTPPSKEVLQRHLAVEKGETFQMIVVESPSTTQVKDWDVSGVKEKGVQVKQETVCFEWCIGLSKAVDLHILLQRHLSDENDYFNLEIGVGNDLCKLFAGPKEVCLLFEDDLFSNQNYTEYQRSMKLASLLLRELAERSFDNQLTFQQLDLSWTDDAGDLSPTVAGAESGKASPTLSGLADLFELFGDMRNCSSEIQRIQEGIEEELCEEGAAAVVADLVKAFLANGIPSGHMHRPGVLI